MTLRSIADSFLKLIGGKDSDAAVMLETGYRNDQGQRTNPVGVHLILNFVEETNTPAFMNWLRAKRDAQVAEDEAKKAKN